jgi:hypothetical protein
MRARKYSYGGAWSNMNTVKRNGLPFTLVYKLNPNVSFIYVNSLEPLFCSQPTQSLDFEVSFGLGTLVSIS